MPQFPHPRWCTGAERSGGGNGGCPPQPPSGKTVDQPGAPSKSSNSNFQILDLVLVESGGEQSGGSLPSPELVDLCIYVIDVAAGGQNPAQGRVLALPLRLLVINKIDLASMGGATWR